MKIKVTSVIPCKTPPEMFIHSVSPSSVLTIDLICVYAIMIALIISSCILYALSISSICPRCMESKLLKIDEKDSCQILCICAFDNSSKYLLRGRSINSKTILIIS